MYQHYESIISERGQVTLPKECRDQFGLKPGVSVSFVPSTKGLLLKKLINKKDNPFKKIQGFLKDGTTTDEYMQEIRGSVE